jgi:hypothetical protein
MKVDNRRIGGRAIENVASLATVRSQTDHHSACVFKRVADIRGLCPLVLDDLMRLPRRACRCNIYMYLSALQRAVVPTSSIGNLPKQTENPSIPVTNGFT